jgi:XTP/dITP diphosphohydrolase
VPRTLYIASSNAGKLREFISTAQPMGLRIAPLPGLNQITPPPEDQTTFAGNAIEKAVYYSGRLPGEIVLADDSGLEVEALHGAPGVRSARYAADAHFLNAAPAAAPEDERNNLLLLAELDGTPEPARGARYCCALAAARDGRVLLVKQGFVSGRILREARGTGGFGYDPLFYLPALGRTMAELTLETKDALSHRGKALRAVLAELI